MTLRGAFFSRPWDSQPQEAAAAAPDVPLLGLWVPGQPNAVSNAGLPVLGPATGVKLGGGVVGRRWHNASTQANSYVQLLADSSVLPTTACTIIVIGRQLTLNNGGIGLDSSTLAQKCGISIANSSSQIDWDFGGATSGTTRLRSAALSNLSERDVWACTTGSRGMEVWRNGSLIASNGATPTRSASTARWGIGLNTAASWSSNSNTAFAYYAVAISKTQLPAAFLAQLSSPEATFGALFEPYRIFVPMAAAGGGATASVTGAGTTSSAGALAAAGTATTTLAGALATSAAGTVSASASTNASIAIAGAATASAVGTLTAAGAAAASLTGATSSSAAGAVSAAGAATATLAGISAAASAGTVSAAAGGNATVALSGISATSAAGTLTASGAAAKTLTGASAAATAGTVTASSGTNATATLTGCAVSASVGALSASGAAQIVLTGAGASAIAGRVSVAEAAVATPQLFLPPLQLPVNVSSVYDRDLQRAIKGWADRATQIINDLASRVP